MLHASHSGQIPDIATRKIATAICVLAVAVTSRASAGPVDELKFGVLAHDVIARKELSADINGEILFEPIGLLTDERNPPWLRAMLEPRPGLGFTANTNGKTSQGNLDLDWREKVVDRVMGADDEIYAELQAGGSFNNGKTGETASDREALGSHVLFHLSFESGYALTGHYSLGLYFDHISNGGLAQYNRSLNNAGLRFGYRP